jgi:hypothetical protein
MAAMVSSHPLPDAAQFIVTNVSAKGAKYVVPARREKEVMNIIGDGNKATSICTGDIVAPEEIKPTFRTPCKFIMVGQIAIKM